MNQPIDKQYLQKFISAVLTVNFNFSIINLNSLPILIKPGVEHLTKTNLLKINFRNDLSSDVCINYIKLMTLIQTCKENKNVQLMQFKRNCRTPIFNN